MLQCIKKWLKGTDINDCNIEVKIKYTNKENQDRHYRNIASYNVKVFWRIEGMWFWRFAGFVETPSYNGLVSEISDHKAAQYLHDAAIVVKKHLRGGESIAKLRTRFHVSELNKPVTRQLERKYL